MQESQIQRTGQSNSANPGPGEGQREFRGDRSRDRESIWSIPQHLRLWYVALFSAQFLLLLVLVVLEQLFAIPWATSILNLYRGMGPIILPMVGSTYVALEGIMLAEWLRERDRRKAEEIREGGLVEGLEKGREEGREEGLVEGLGKGREEGREEGTQERDRQWLDWYERLQVAQRDGRSFTEPPPVSAENRTGQ